MTWAMMQDLPFQSMLEFGSNTGECYRYLQVRPDQRYLGLDVHDPPRWVPNPPHRVLVADVFTWEPEPGAQWDLVFCDAHGGENSLLLTAITRRQITLAQRVHPRWIAVDDCWVPMIAHAALDMLGVPTRFPSLESTSTSCWVWEQAA